MYFCGAHMHQKLAISTKCSSLIWWIVMVSVTSVNLFLTHELFIALAYWWDCFRRVFNTGQIFLSDWQQFLYGGLKFSRWVWGNTQLSARPLPFIWFLLLLSYLRHNHRMLLLSSQRPKSQFLGWKHQHSIGEYLLSASYGQTQWVMERQAEVPDLEQVTVHNPRVSTAHTLFSLRVLR